MAISGKAFSGKDSLATAIGKIYSKVKIVHMADILKQLCLELRGDKELCVYNCMPESIIKEMRGITYRTPISDKKDRDLLIAIGEYARRFNENIWISLLLQKHIHNIIDPQQIVIVADMRLKNEFAVFKKLGFLMVRVNRNYGNDVNEAYKILYGAYLTKEQQESPTETELDGIFSWDYQTEYNISFETLTGEVANRIFDMATSK